MSFDPKIAAEELLKLADLIEKEASEKTVFSCDKCNHTVTLSAINNIRTDFAKKQATELGAEVEARLVTVNDKVACPECSGAMGYAPTAESEKFYVESADEAKDPLADLDLDFGDEDTDKKEEKKDKEPEAEKPAEEPKEEEAPKEEPPKEEKPAEEPAEDLTDDEIFEPVDEQAEKQEMVKEEEKEKKEKAPKKEKKEDKEDKPTPKFEKMPKEASDIFMEKIAKYSL